MHNNDISRKEGLLFEAPPRKTPLASSQRVGVLTTPRTRPTTDVEPNHSSSIAFCYTHRSLCSSHGDSTPPYHHLQLMESSMKHHPSSVSVLQSSVTIAPESLSFQNSSFRPEQAFQNGGNKIGNLLNELHKEDPVTQSSYNRLNTTPNKLVPKLLLTELHRHSTDSPQLPSNPFCTSSHLLLPRGQELTQQTKGESKVKQLSKTTKKPLKAAPLHLPYDQLTPRRRDRQFQLFDPSFHSPRGNNCISRLGSPVVTIPSSVGIVENDSSSRPARSLVSIPKVGSYISTNNSSCPTQEFAVAKCQPKKSCISFSQERSQTSKVGFPTKDGTCLQLLAPKYPTVSNEEFYSPSPCSVSSSTAESSSSSSFRRNSTNNQLIAKLTHDTSVNNPQHDLKTGSMKTDSITKDSSYEPQSQQFLFSQSTNSSTNESSTFHPHIVSNNTEFNDILEAVVEESQLQQLQISSGKNTPISSQNSDEYVTVATYSIKSTKSSPSCSKEQQSSLSIEVSDISGNDWSEYSIIKRPTLKSDQRGVDMLSPHFHGVERRPKEAVRLIDKENRNIRKIKNFIKGRNTKQSSFKLSTANTGVLKNNKGFHKEGDSRILRPIVPEPKCEKEDINIRRMQKTKTYPNQTLDVSSMDTRWKYHTDILVPMQGDKDTSEIFQTINYDPKAHPHSLVSHNLSQHSSSPKGFEETQKLISKDARANLYKNRNPVKSLGDRETISSGAPGALSPNSSFASKETSSDELPLYTCPSIISNESSHSFFDGELSLKLQQLQWLMRIYKKKSTLLSKMLNKKRRQFSGIGKSSTWKSGSVFGRRGSHGIKKEESSESNEMEDNQSDWTDTGDEVEKKSSNVCFNNHPTIFNLSEDTVNTSGDSLIFSFEMGRASSQRQPEAVLPLGLAQQLASHRLSQLEFRMRNQRLLIENLQKTLGPMREECLKSMEVKQEKLALQELLISTTRQAADVCSRNRRLSRQFEAVLDANRVLAQKLVTMKDQKDTSQIKLRRFWEQIETFQEDLIAGAHRDFSIESSSSFYLNNSSKQFEYAD